MNFKNNLNVESIDEVVFLSENFKLNSKLKFFFKKNKPLVISLDYNTMKKQGCRN